MNFLEWNGVHFVQPWVNKTCCITELPVGETSYSHYGEPPYTYSTLGVVSLVKYDKNLVHGFCVFTNLCLLSRKCNQYFSFYFIEWHSRSFHFYTPLKHQHFCSTHDSLMNYSIKCGAWFITSSLFNNFSIKLGENSTLQYFQNQYLLALGIFATVST